MNEIFLTQLEKEDLAALVCVLGSKLAQITEAGLYGEIEKMGGRTLHELLKESEQFLESFEIVDSSQPHDWRYLHTDVLKQFDNYMTSYNDKYSE